MSTSLRKFAKNLRINDLVVFLNPDDELIVNRNTRGNQNPGDSQSMSVKEAVKYGAWDTERGTMTASVWYNGSPVGLIGKRVYAMVNTREQTAWQSAAAEPRETLTNETYKS